MSDLRDRLIGLAERFPEPGDLEGLERRRGRRPERQRFTIVALALLIAAAGITSAYLALRPSGLVVSPGPIAAADVLRIECDGQTARILTPTVRTQSDGVHLEIENTATFETHTSISSSGGVAGNPPVPPGETTSSVTGSMSPGIARVWCGPARTDVSEGPPEGRVEIVDPEGHWHPMSLDCSGGPIVATPELHVDPGRPGETGPPVEIIRRRFAKILREGDIVDRGGYPDAASPLGATVRVVRSEAVIGVFHLVYAAPVDGEPTYLQDSYKTCRDFYEEFIRAG